jgi:hypothetical protein
VKGQNFLECGQSSWRELRCHLAKGKSTPSHGHKNSGTPFLFQSSICGPWTHLFLTSFLWIFTLEFFSFSNFSLIYSSLLFNYLIIYYAGQCGLPRIVEYELWKGIEGDGRKTRHQWVT